MTNYRREDYRRLAWLLILTWGYKEAIQRAKEMSDDFQQLIQVLQYTASDPDNIWCRQATIVLNEYYFRAEELLTAFRFWCDAKAVKGRLAQLSAHKQEQVRREALEEAVLCAEKELKTIKLPDGPYDDDTPPKAVRDHIVGAIRALASREKPGLKTL